MFETLGGAVADKVARVSAEESQEAMLRRRIYEHFQRGFEEEEQEDNDGFMGRATDPFEELEAAISGLLEKLKRLLYLWH